MGKIREGVGFRLESVRCNLCGGCDTKLWAKTSYKECLNRRPELNSENEMIILDETLANYRFSIVECRNCGLIYVNPRLTKGSLDGMYQGGYFTFYTDVESEAHRKRRETFKTEIKEIEKLVSQNKELYAGKATIKILDDGCGGGFFLAGLDNLWERYGTDVNPAAIEFGKRTFGLNLMQGKIEELAFPDEYFDVVKLRGTIEHLADPAGELHEIHRILKPGGIIALNTLNIGSICARIYQAKFRLVAPVGHIYYFSTETLSLMLRKVGFKVIQVAYPYFDTPYANWKDFIKILFDLLSLRVFWVTGTVSPPFYGSIVDIYAVKTNQTK